MIYGNGHLTRTVVVHLDQGEDILESLNECVAAAGIRNGLILTGYGTVDRYRIHAVKTNGLPPVDQFVTEERPLEVLALQGTIAGGQIHAHITFSDLERSFGGHLEPGCRVLYLCDVVIGELQGLDMEFALRPDTGLWLLTVRPGREAPGPAVALDGAGNGTVSWRRAGWDPRT